MARPPLRRWVRLGVSVGALALLLSIVPLQSLLAAMGQVPVRTFIFALVLFMLGHVAAAAKWRLLQRGETGVSIVATLRAHFSGVLANLWLPSVVGGDLVRAGLVFRQSSRPALVAVASLVDRIIDSVSLLLLAAAGLLLVGAPFQGARQLLLAAVVAAALGGAVAVGGYRYLRAHATNERVRQVVAAFAFLAERPGLVVVALAMSIGVQVTFIAVNIALGRAVGVAAPEGAWLMAWPLAKLAALAPISAAGLGVREAALVVLLRPFGDPAEAILAAGLLWQAVFILGGALGLGVLSLVPDALAVGREPLRSPRK